MAKFKGNFVSDTSNKYDIPCVLFPSKGADRQLLTKSWRTIVRKRSKIILLLRHIFPHVAMLVRE